MKNHKGSNVALKNIDVYIVIGPLNDYGAIMFNGLTRLVTNVEVYILYGTILLFTKFIFELFVIFLFNIRKIMRHLILKTLTTLRLDLPIKLQKNLGNKRLIIESCSVRYH